MFEPHIFYKKANNFIKETSKGKYDLNLKRAPKKRHT